MPEPPDTLRNGSYQGRLESASGRALHVHLRIDRDLAVVSADFEQAGNYFASLRGRFIETDGRLVATAPRVIFDAESRSTVGGTLELTPQPCGLHVRCVLPEALPEVHEGNASFHSPHFRTLNLEIDKLDGMPWPPEFFGTDIPGHQQPDPPPLEQVSLSSIFDRAGIETRLHFSDGALDAGLGGQTGRPWEGDRWDERELHELMDTSYGRNLGDREWWLYLLVVTRFDGGPDTDSNGSIPLDDDGLPFNGGRGVTGIIFDHSTGNVTDPWSPFFEWFEQKNPQFRHLFDFGRSGGFENSRARQGVAVFWREMLDFVSGDAEPWEKNRRFLRTIVHELGHALNLAHTWLVDRPSSLSFMNYPQRHPSGSSSYWRSFDYAFDPEELFHCQHGFFNEVVPGGRQEFMQWTPSSVFRDPTAGGTRSSISLDLAPGKQVFRFTEPVTVKVRVRNHTSESLPIGRLSPSYGNISFVIRKPNGKVSRYVAPVFKCEESRTELGRSETREHLTSLAFGADGFTFDAPGRYEITASMPDPASGALVVARPVALWIGYPNEADERVAHTVFEAETGLFLYFNGGEHLESAKDALRQVVEEHPEHPFSAHANLALGLNALAGQKRPLAGDRGLVKDHDPDAAEPYLRAAAEADVLNEMSQRRLESTIERFVEGDGEAKGEGGGSKKGKSGKGKKSG